MLDEIAEEKRIYMNSIPRQIVAKEMASESFAFTISREEARRLRGAALDNLVRCDLVIQNLDREMCTEIISAAREFEGTLRKIVAGDCISPATEKNF